jgi:hypothetical protein
MDAAELLPVFAGLATAAGSLAGSWVLLRKTRQELGKIEAERAKVEAERVKILAETSSLAKKSDLDRAMALVDQLQEDNSRLRARLADMETREERRYHEIMTLKTGILVLINQIRGLGVEPAWQPIWAADCLEDREQEAEES